MGIHLVAGVVALLVVSVPVCAAEIRGDKEGKRPNCLETAPGANGNARTYLVNGTRFCAMNCDQGTIFYSDHTCNCICKKNFGLSGEHCYRASWSQWSSWSQCLKSDWGGLQRRERVCKVSDKEFPRSCDGRGSMTRTCTAIKKPFKVRKNVNDLSNEELHDLLQAMTKFKKDKTKRGYRNIASWHGYPGRCPWYKHIERHEDNHCSWHNHPLFLPWHRMLIKQFELGISRFLKNKTIGIPFWDWTEKSTGLPSLLKGPEIYDPVLKKYGENPFYKTLIMRHEGVDIYTKRLPYYPGLLMDRYIIRGAVRALLTHDYFNFDNQINAPHAQIHNCFCINDSLTDNDNDTCHFGLLSTYFAAWEPAFLLHHSAMDRLFVIKRELEELNGVADWTASRVIGQTRKRPDLRRRDIAEAFDWPMSPFCNKSMNPESVTGNDGMWTMHNAFYNEQLFGYKYDNFDFGHDYKWEDLQRDYRKIIKNGNHWNDDYFMTQLGELTEANSMPGRYAGVCVRIEPNPSWSLKIEWKKTGVMNHVL